MEILRFAGGRMLITLTREEFSRCAREKPGSGPENGKETLPAFLDAVCAAAGVCWRREGVRAKLYPSGDGGCEIFLFDAPEETARAEEAPGGYLCFPEDGTADRVAALFRNAGVRGEIYLEEPTGRICFFCAPKDGALLLEEFGRRAGEGVRSYLDEHFLPLGAL